MNNTTNTGKFFVGNETYASTSAVFDGYIAEFYIINNSQLAPTSFGETDDNGVWIPTDASGDLTFGHNGVYLEFKQTGTSQNSSGIGADTSGEDHHFAIANNNSAFAATDITTDTPTNNFATFNSLYPSLSLTNHYQTTLSEGNLQAVSVNAGSGSGVSTIGITSGKWYAEFKQTSSSHDNNYAMVGINGDISGFINNHPAGTGAVGYSPFGYAYWGYNHTTSNGNKVNDDTSANYGDPYFTNDIIGVAVDLDNLAIYVSKNGTWQASSDPESGASRTNAMFNLTAPASTRDGVYHFVVGDASSSNNCTFQANFGNPVHSISSGNSDGAGYGNFEYAVPAGYYALCTKNLADYG